MQLKWLTGCMSWTTATKSMPFLCLRSNSANTYQVATHLALRGTQDLCVGAECRCPSLLRHHSQLAIMMVSHRERSNQTCDDTECSSRAADAKVLSTDTRAARMKLLVAAERGRTSAPEATSRKRNESTSIRDVLCKGVVEKR